MHRTEKFLKVLVLVVLLNGSAYAASSAECLDHLGGGYGDVGCYDGLAADLVRENDVLYKSIRKSMPPDNPEAKLIDEYMVAQRQAIKFCLLQRDAGSKWVKSPDGTLYPALYAGCVYTLRKAQNTFLQDLFEMSKW